MLSVPSLSFAAKTHRVKKHETLYSLAKKYHVTVEELKAANNLVGNSVKPRVVLVIPARSVSEGKNEAASSAVYKVKKSETLSRIAKKTGVSVAELKRLNGLRGSKVKAGKVLVLKESEPAEEPKVKVVKKLQLRHGDLFNEKDYEQSLQELTALEPEQQVDLAKNAELKVDNLKELKKSAYGFLGTRYRFGGSSRSGIDCSSFVQHVFRDLEVALPRTAREQFEVGNAVAPGDLQKGDLIFFATYASYPSHVGIYLGNNKMIHASSRDRRVVISSLNTSYYRSRFLGAKRIAKVNPDVFKLDDLILGVEEENPEEMLENDALGLTSSN
ncbi:peptidoglycan-binding protein LysM [Geoanaerobacter pelophilus]|uniref:Peptidoglycan-binding protein LysM n=2 Tax=Geobacteraceae TaxID=213422 RepID=A0ABQ0MPK3_9BACT|nr:peptidoglycan-binding protein LysM [Geoanaerobacter pelophilus]